MLLQFSLYAACSILSFSSYASASVTGHARLHRQHSHPARRHEAGIDARSAPGSVQVPLSELQLLQTETTSFQQWMTSWINSESHTDRESSVALLQQEINAYQGWMTAWLAAVNSPGGPSSIPLPPRVPVTLPAGSSLVLSTSHTTKPTSHNVIPHKPTTTTKPTSHIVIPQKPTITTKPTSHIVIPQKPTTTTKPRRSTAIQLAGEFFEQPHSTNLSTSIGLSSQAPSQLSFITSQTPVPSGLLPRPTSTQIFTPPLATPSPITGGPSGGQGSSGGFNAQSSQNLAVYYGQTGATGQFTLGDMCQNQNVDIVILAFLTTFFGPGGFPTLNFGPACGGQTPEMTAAGATGLLNCPDMATQISQCQSLGKKVLLSLGGSEATTAFSSDSQAATFATTLWDLFGSGTGVNPGLRPFGQVKVDGFDVDNEDHSTGSYSAFVSSLRSNMNKDSSRTYYISAAPQCPRPDASIPLDAMQTMDFVFVQFYNNAAANCDVGQPGFLDSLKAWSADLSANGAGPKLYVGAPACPDCAGAGYLDPGAMASAISGIKSSGLSNLGGVMLWDGSEAMANTNGGGDYTTVVKGALH